MLGATTRESAMPVYAFNGTTPQLPENGDCFIAPGAQVIGNVKIEAGASIWFNVVIRGDNELIHIGPGANVQDGSTLHTDPGFPLIIGSNATIGHNVILHGCQIGEGALIGMGSIVMNGVKIGANALVGANSLITEGKEFPDGAMIMGAPGKLVRMLDENQAKAGRMTAANYAMRASQFRAGLKKIVD
jgi:carbonic anhydrase/acetyltransferase-like protein (isoleucine patch superfamily)